METTHPADQQSTQGPSTTDARSSGLDAVDRESWLHFLSRETKFIMRWAVLIFGMATVLSMIVFFPVALIPGFALLGAFILLMIAHFIEQRTLQPGDPHDETAEDQQHMRRVAIKAKPNPGAAKQQRIEEAVERKIRRTVVGIIVCVAVAALAIAGLVYGGQFELLMIGGFILFAYTLLVAAPVWLGWLNDEAEDETHRLEDRLDQSTP
jgi:hypothetical protein